MIEQLCDILDKMHTGSMPIIHRDIKPQNIFIRDGKVILFDFDIARHYDPDKQKDTTVLGSVGYAAPEQFGFLQTSIQSDIYSCGKLLQVMLTGKLEQKVEGRIGKVIDKALSMDPKDRFKSALELKEALKKKTFIIPGINNDTLKGKIGSWVFWLLNIWVVIDIDVNQNTSFKHDILFPISCFISLALAQIVICNRNIWFKHQNKSLHRLYLVLSFFGSLIISFLILMIIDEIMLMA